MATTVFILYLVTNLGTTFQFEKRDVIAVFTNWAVCQATADLDSHNLSKPYMRYECKAEALYQ